jgi:hypothetical protein
MMAQDIISCVKELTDQEKTYTDQANLYTTYMRTGKHQDLDEYDSFFVDKDKIASSYSTDADKSRPPYIQYNSVLKQVMSKEKWDKYRDLKCDKGIYFTQCIFPDIKHRDNTIGLVAGSTSCYQKFKEVFYPFI